MRDADKTLLDGLALVTDLNTTEWSLVVAEVEKAGGIRETAGTARLEIERAVKKARDLVEKHPGHANQASHGGGRSGARGGSEGGEKLTPSGYRNVPIGSDGKGLGSKRQRTRQAELAQSAASDRMDAAAREVGLVRTPSGSSSNVAGAKFRAGEARKLHGMARSESDPAKKADLYRRSAKEAKRASELFEEENYHNAAEALNDAARSMTSAAAMTGSLSKAVEPVEKHPGHGDQSVHGGSRGKGRASSSSPAAGAGGTSDVDAVLNDPKFKEAQSKLTEEYRKHQTAVSRSDMSRKTKQEALTDLARIEEVVVSMRQAKSVRELDDLRARATDIGENYKGTIRAVQDMRRKRHYASGRGDREPYRERNLLGGLDEASLQDLADNLPIPNTYD